MIGYKMAVKIKLTFLARLGWVTNMKCKHNHRKLQRCVIMDKKYAECQRHLIGRAIAIKSVNIIASIDDKICLNIVASGFIAKNIQSIQLPQIIQHAALRLWFVLSKCNVLGVRAVFSQNPTSTASVV